MIQLEEERQRPYFVDNDFYNNKYVMIGKLRYFCIKEREVSKLEKYSEEKENNSEKDNKIIFFIIIKKY